jgi:hypothetical protein
MSQSTTNSQPTPAYEDPMAPNGVVRPDAPAPGWFLAGMRQISEAIGAVVHHQHHEYLENKRLPHALKITDALVKPHLLSNGDVLLLTVFPVASEQNFVVFFTPKFADGTDLMQRGVGVPHADVQVIDYTVFAFKENGPLMSNAAPQHMGSELVAELKRQAAAMPLRAVQFLYFTILKPRVKEGFEDPNGYLDKIIAQTNGVKEEAPAKRGPTPA